VSRPEQAHLLTQHQQLKMKTETHSTFDFHSVHENLNIKVHFECTLSSHADIFLQQVSLVETPLVGQCTYISLCGF
jgi:hypothetical protein